MRLNQKQQGAIFGLVCLAVLFVVVALYFRGGLFSVSYGAFTSISATKLMTFNDYLGLGLPQNDTYWVLQFSANNYQTDSLVGSKYANQLTATDSSGVQYTNKDQFQITVEPTTTSQSCSAQLSIASGYTGVYKIARQQKTFNIADCGIYGVNPTGSSIYSWCKNDIKGNALAIPDSGYWGCNAVCYSSVQVGQLGTQIGTTKINWGEKITLTDQWTDKSTSAVLNPDTMEVMLSDPRTGTIVGKARWVGNMISSTAPCTYTFVSAPKTVYVPNAPTGVTVPRTGWIIGDQNSYEKYYADMTAFNQVTAGTTSKSASEIDALVTQVNSEADTFLSGTQNPPFNGASTSGTQANGQVNLPLYNDKLVFPQLNIIISQSFLPFIAIQQQYGEPEILGLPATKTGSVGSTIYYTATIRNKGQNTGAFNLAIQNCNKGLSASVSPTSTSVLTPGGTQTIIITATSSGAISSQVQASCDLMATAQNAPNLTATGQIFATLIPQCLIQCSSPAIRNPDTSICGCVCTLAGTAGVDWTWNDLQTTCAKKQGCGFQVCQYGQDPISCACNPAPCQTLTCPANYKTNDACNGCVCGLTVAGTPNGYFLNATACEYQKQKGVVPICPNGQTAQPDGTCAGPDYTLWLLIGGGIVILAGVYMMTRKKK